MKTESKPFTDGHQRLFHIVGAVLAISGFFILLSILAAFFTDSSIPVIQMICQPSHAVSLVLLGMTLYPGILGPLASKLQTRQIPLIFVGVATLNLGLDLWTDHQGTVTLAASHDHFPLRAGDMENINFLLIALALHTILFRPKGLGIRLLYVVTLFSFTMTINYIYKVPYFYLAPFLHTDYPLITFVQLTVSIIASLYHPNVGLAGLFTGDKIGNIMLRRIFPWTILIICIQGAVRIFFFKRGTFTFEFGVALAAITFLTVALIILTNTAKYLNQLNYRRESAESALRNLNKSLEAKVKQRTLALKLSEEKFHKVFKMSPVGMAISEVPSGKLLEINDRFIQQTGYTRSQVIGKSSSEIGLLSAKDVEKARTVLRHQGSISNYETPYYTQNGETKMGLLSTEIIIIEDIKYAITTVFDVTERIAFEKKIQEVSRAKEQFLANMSHEIRTPMNAIIGFTNLMDHINMDEEGRRYLSYIKSSGENLLVLINDILDFSKIEAGMMVLEKIPFNMSDLIQSLHMMFAAKAQGKGLTLKMEVDPDIPEVLLGDPTRLTQILTNLISNAIKFTEAGMVMVSLKCIKENSDKTHIQFQVQDTGIGIAPEKQNEIYDRFVQASAETTRDFGGSGLGLTIVKRLVELQNGSLKLESALGQGSTFSIMIPYQIGQDINAAQAAKDSAKNLLPPFQDGAKVLLVEDHKINQILAEDVLKKFGCEVTIAIHGAESLEFLQENSYDIVLMDIQMPIMDGYTAARLIRNKLNLDVPIVAMTAHVMAGEKEKCISFGMNDYLSKPFKNEDLYAVLQKYIAQDRPYIRDIT
ncbi:PAS domain-containing hybrid sensor histidine kinase/response regulator [Dyadobacter tibetensis]|uniref:PAS domain-containing hybrid sensor histidine kinase/response regulator n=1 Tax=Dyadobacter tibetensis TaxID=1211851 RepID=UPI00047155BC|nr:ATP-binding protein [Dyadobacter tibetensis]